MALNLRDCTFSGPALPEPFVKFELERQLARLSPMPKETGPESRSLQEHWDRYRSRLRALADGGGEQRVLNHVVEPLAPLLGYGSPVRQETIRTREGDEDGGWWMPALEGTGGLRVWTVGLNIDLDAPNRRGRAYRFSPTRVASRVLLTKGERAGLLTDGMELRLLLCDPARPDSHISIALGRDGGWRGSRETPPSLRLLIALARPKGVAALTELIEAARLSQTTVTRKLREQARNAVRDFVQGVLDEPANAPLLSGPNLARTLWDEGLIIVYRLLFVLKMESSADPSRAFSFAATSLWRNSYSPNTALAPVVENALKNQDTGGFLEHSLRTLFRLFSEGLDSVELRVSPLGGALFGAQTTPLLDSLTWGEPAVTHLLNALLWTPGEKKTERERVHYGSLDVEDLGRVYEALLELEPGITTEPMCRLRRAKLEVVVPAAQGLPYRAQVAAEGTADGAEEEEAEEEEDEAPKKGKGKTKVAWVEDIPAGRFFLRTGLGRKSSGSYYTPHPFVRFLIQETLGPQVAQRSPQNDPQPLQILALKVLDPAMGSGHFLVEACRFLGDALYEACRLCDERASTAEEAGNPTLAAALRARVEALPDPNNELLAWLPSRAPEGTTGGLSQQRAQSLCRRLVAVHCLYGVDKNRLAVELAKLSLWLESYAEGLPLTFLDHRLVCGDSLTGPFLEHLFTWPQTGGPVDDALLHQGLRARLTTSLARALEGVGDLTASVGKDVADLERKATAKTRLDSALAPFRSLAAVWAGAVMVGEAAGDAAYLRALTAIAADLPVPSEPTLDRLIAVGTGGVVYDLAFPEVFHADGKVERTGGFDAVVGNPPWEKARVERRDIMAALSPEFMEGREVAGVGDEHKRLQSSFATSVAATAIESAMEQSQRVARRLCPDRADGLDLLIDVATEDLYQYFLLLSMSLVSEAGATGLVLGGGLAKSPSERPIRKALLSHWTPRIFVHYFNLEQLFGGASSRISFVILVEQRQAHNGLVSMASDLRHFHELTGTSSDTRTRSFPLSKVRDASASGSDFSEITNTTDAINQNQGSAGSTLEEEGIIVSEGLHRTGTKEYLRELSEILPEAIDARDPDTIIRLNTLGYACLYGGKSITNYDAQPTAKSGKWLPVVDIVVDINAPRVGAAAQKLGHYRMAWRNTCGHVATNERSSRAVLLPPGVEAAGSIIIEQEPYRRPDSSALRMVGLFNAFAFDLEVRLRVQTNFNKAILSQVRVPTSINRLSSIFLSHSALRLTCNHAGYAPLWTEQLRDVWREATPPYTWPVLAGDDARWAVRAAIDAVVAEAYGLDREQYAHVLSSFSHKSYPKAPTLCLAAFDELKEIGLDTFVQKHDPYHNIPLNEALPEPVIHFGANEEEKTSPAAEVPRSPPQKAVEAEPSPWSTLSETDRAVLLVALLIERDRSAPKDARDLGAVKVEKFLHLAECWAGVELGRNPLRNVAGPEDTRLRKKMFFRAAKTNRFEERPMLGRHDIVPLDGFSKAVEQAKAVFGSNAKVMELVEIVANRSCKKAEVLATFYAAWNEQLAEGKPTDDEALMSAFFAWNAEKVGKFEEDQELLHNCLRFMREKGIVPDGSARPMRELKTGA